MFSIRSNTLAVTPARIQPFMSRQRDKPRFDRPSRRSSKRTVPAFNALRRLPETEYLAGAREPCGVGEPRKDPPATRVGPVHSSLPVSAETCTSWACSRSTA